MTANGRAPWSADLSAGSIRRILVIKWSAMGDVVIATAAMQDLVEAFPGSEIHLNVLAPWQRLFDGDPRFGRVFHPELRRRGRRVRGALEWLSLVRGGGYDLVVDLQCNDHTWLLLSALALGGARIPHLAGFHRRFPYSVAPDHPRRGVHVHERAGAMLRALGLEPRQERPVLHIPQADRERVVRLRERHDLVDDDYAMLLPGCQAAGYLKRWGVARYAELAHRLRAGGLGRVVLVGGPDETDECRAIAERCGRWLVNLCGETAIRELVPLGEGAALIVANDTGTAHVAAAAGRPMVVLCGPTDPRRVKPLGANVVAMQADLPCINCYRKHCVHHSCMALLTPASVERRAAELREAEAGHT